MQRGNRERASRSKMVVPSNEEKLNPSITADVPRLGTLPKTTTILLGQPLEGFYKHAGNPSCSLTSRCIKCL